MTTTHTTNEKGHGCDPVPFQNHTSNVCDFATAGNQGKALSNQIAHLTPPSPDKAAILAALVVLFDPGDVIELRAFPKGRKRTDAGYFDADHWDALADHAVRLSASGAAVYITLNPVDPQLLSRYSNRVEPFAASTTTDKQVIRRRWLLIDLDPVRPSGTSATDTQLEAARIKAREVYSYLVGIGWPLPVVAISGNGYHLLCAIDLPNDEVSTALVKAVLLALGERFDDAHTKVDRSVFNAARICKLYGTVANKGDHTAAAPWRLSCLLQAPARAVVSVEQLAMVQPPAMAAAPGTRPVPTAPTTRTTGSFNLEDFLARHGMAYTTDQHDGRERFKLAACPFNPEHVNGEAAVFRKPSGELGFKCQHDSCASKSWREVRDLLDGPRTADTSTPARREHQPELDNAPDDEPEARHVNQPRPSEAMLYGLAGDVGNTAAATTEANRYAVCMGFMSFLSGMAGRDIYLPVGNTRHHPRLFTLHVGRSSRGRKGDALSLVHRIRHAIDKREFESGTIGGSLLGQVHTGGLSSREGLVMFIHNGFKQGKDEVPAIEDKRLWVVESEFANILQQSKRDGNTLSPALRDAWDGVSIKPATKSLPLWTTDPHIAIAAAITPTELVELMKARELSNGFANRFIIFWAERERLIPFPRATSEADLLGLAERTEKVLRFMKGNYPASKDSRAMTLSHEAHTAYERLYRGLNATTGSPRLDGILERRAPMLLRMAMLFAMTDLTLTIEVHHIKAAQAWVTYWMDSVRYVFGEAADEANVAERQESADRLLAYLTQKGEATRTEITVECFNKHAPPGGLNAVIAELLNATPPRIVTMKRPRPGGNPGSPTTIYRPLSQNTRANSAKSANCGSGIGFEPLQDAAKSGRTLRNEGDETGDGSSDFAEFADSSQHENTDAGRVDIHTSHISHTSHADAENSDDVEVF